MTESLQNIPIKRYLLIFKKAIQRSLLILVPLFIISLFVFGLPRAGQNPPYEYNYQALIYFIFPFVLIYFYNLIQDFLFYLLFQFSISNKVVIIKRGIIKINITNIPFDKIQDINTNQDFYDRLFGMKTVIFQTASVSSKEALIEGLSIKNFEKISHLMVV